MGRKRKQGTLANAEAQARQRKWEQMRQQLQDDDLKVVLGQQAGRRLVMRVIEEIAGVFGDAFTGNALGSAHLEGKRNVGVTLMLEAQRVAPELYVQMVNENLADKSLDETHKKNTEDQAADGGEETDDER